MGTSKIEQLIEDIFDYVEGARSSIGNPNKVVLQRSGLYDMLDELRVCVPEEIKKYQKIIANREKIIDDANAKASIIIDQANQRAATLIDESEMVRQANQHAQEIVTAAGAEANRIIGEANEEATQIRTAAIAYTNDLMTNAESILQNAYKNTKSRYDAVFEALKEDITIVQNNKRELERDLPREVIQPESNEENPSDDEQLEDLLDEVDNI